MYCLINRYFDPFVYFDQKQTRTAITNLFFNADIRNRIQVIVYRYFFSSDDGVVVDGDDDDDDDDDVLIIMLVMPNIHFLG